MKPVFAFVVGLLLALTVATQLRPMGLRVGVAELGLAALVVGVGMMALLRPNSMRLVPTERFLGAALVLMGAFLGVGTLWGVLSQGAQDPAWATGAAYVLSAATLIALWTADRRGWLKASTVVASTAVATVLVSAASLTMGWLGLGPCDPWYEGDSLRFTACSDNPNQLGLLFAATPFVLLDAFRRSRSKGMRLILGGSLVAALGFGIATGSDAMVVAWAAGVFAGAVCWLASMGRRAVPLLASGAFLALALGAVIVAWNPSIIERGAERVIAAADTNDQASVRFALWERGIESALDSKLLGWGPGAYSLPDDEGTRQEAHNTLIDWATQSGLGGVLALCGAWTAILLGLYRRRQTWLLAAAAGLCAFALFHFVLRQPAFWVLLALPILTLSRWPLEQGHRRHLAGHLRPCRIGEERAV